MRLFFGSFLLTIAAHAATISTTMTVSNVPVTLSGTSATISGPVTLTNIGSGTLAATGSITNVNAQGNASVPYTITLSTGDKITGSLTVPTTAFITAGAVTAAATVTGGTGAYNGATGSFASLTGTTAGSILSGGLTLSFSGAGTITTSGGGSTGGGNTPVITQVADAAGYTSKIAQGSIFIVKGTNLSASGYNSSSFALPTSVGGTSITFTPAAGGTGTNAYIVYTYNQSGTNQLAGILPSTLAAGSYNVTVTSSGSTSAATPVTVVASNPQFFTANQGGTGLAVIQNYVSASRLDINRYTTDTIFGSTVSPAYPGQTVIVWLTGMGPVAGGDNVASAGYDFSTHGVKVTANVGGVSIPVLYAGRAPGLAGVDQVNFTLPANVPTGCSVSLQIAAGSVSTQVGSISIAPNASAQACVQPGWTTAQLSNFDHGQTYSIGSWDIFQFSETLPTVGTVKIDEASGAFTVYSGYNLGSIPQNAATISQSGNCTVIQINSSAATATGVGGTSLDAGKVTLTGPSGSNLSATAFTQSADNTYSLQIGEEGLSIPVPGFGNGTLVAGTYTINGAGGNDVGAFTASATIGTPLNITGGLPSTVTESAGLTLNWAAGSNPSDLVYIAGSSTTVGTGSTTTVTGTEFVCTTTIAPLTFTVPSSILTQLPATNQGSLTVYSIPATNLNKFSAPLKAGGSIDSYFLIGVGYGGVVAYK